MDDKRRFVNLLRKYFDIVRLPGASLQDIVAHRHIVADVLSTMSESFGSSQPIAIEFDDKFVLWVKPCSKDTQTYLCFKAADFSFKQLDGLIDGELSLNHLLLSLVVPLVSKVSLASSLELSLASNSWNNYVSLVGFESDNVRPVQLEALSAQLDLEGFAILHGNSSSGKTTLALSILHERTNKFVFNQIYDLNTSIELLILLIKNGRNFSLLIDDIQAIASEAKVILELIEIQSSTFVERNVNIIVVCWSSFFYGNVVELFDRHAVFLVKATSVKNTLLSQLTQRERNILQSLQIESLHLIKLAANLIRENGDIDGFDVEKLIFETLISNYTYPTYKQLYVCSLLGKYEIGTPVEIIEVLTSEVWLGGQIVITQKLIEGQLYVGHRTIASFIESYIFKRHTADVIENQRIISTYINRVNVSQIWRVINNIVSNNQSSPTGKYIDVWQLLNSFSSRLECQTSLDKNWKKVPSAMYFTALTLHKLGKSREAVNAADLLIKTCFHDSLDIKRFDISNLQTQFDFIQIRKRMINQDLTRGKNTGYEQAGEIDITTVHENWVLGLVLGVCPLLGEIEQSFIESVISIVFDRQTSKGCWYPVRIPWVTARILIGLAAIGYTVRDKRISAATDYLIECFDESGFVEANTGGWNNKYETTSMVLEALSLIGFDLYSNEKTMQSISALVKSIPDWMQLDNPIDGLVTSSLILKYEGPSEDIFKYIRTLSKANFEKLSSELINVDYNNDQSCAATQIAFYLVELGLYLLKNDIGSLLADYTMRSNIRAKIFVSYRHDSKITKEKVSKIISALEDRDLEVIWDEKLPLGANIVDFMESIPEVQAVIILGTSSYVQRVNERWGGAYYEKEILSSLKLAGKAPLIIPISFEKKYEDGVPIAFRNSKGISCNRLTDNKLMEISSEVERAILMNN